MAKEAYTNSQNFDINIEEIYNDWIKGQTNPKTKRRNGGIDSIRSEINVTDPNNQALFKNFTEQTFNGTSTASFKVEREPQETRCHAFFRFIGFPVVSDSYDYYNPGYDIVINQPGREITVDRKIKIANKLFPGFLELSNAREQYINDNLKKFSNNTSIDACVLALSEINIRDFASVFSKNPNAIESPFKAENQSYNISENSTVGSNNKVSFKDYIGPSKTKPTKFTNKRFHIIKPFIVDPRIDISCPSLKKMAVPFVYDNTQLKVGSVGQVMRPYIEKIIADRFCARNLITLSGESINTAIEQIKNSFLKNQQLVKDISNPSFLLGFSEKTQFIFYLKMLYAMAKAIVESLDLVADAQSKYYWLPIPSKNGPEEGNTVSPTSINFNLPEELLTPDDSDILVLEYRDKLSKISAEIAALRTVPDVASYALSNYTVTFDNKTSNSLGDVTEKEKQKLLKSRTETLTAANNALKNIEIITGEFTGLGLCDIACIIAALYIMPNNSLLGFLDDDAYERAKMYQLSSGDELSKLGIPDERPSDAGIKNALDDFTKTVQGMYNIMSKLIEMSIYGMKYELESS